MKKIIAWAAVLTLCLGLCACGAKQKTEVANPVRESTAQEILDTLGISFVIPEGASDVSYSVIGGDKYDIAQMDFTWQGADCACRIAFTDVPTDGVTDISGMYFDWTEEASAPVGYNDAVLDWIEGEQGVVRWYDYAPGLLYNVSMSSGATKDSLTELATALYQPVQGDADGGSDTELMNLLAAISQNYHDGTAGSSLIAAKYAGTLLDWFASNQPDESTIQASTVDFLSTLSADSLKEFSGQMQSVYAAAQELCGENGAELLSDCGYAATGYPWDAAMMETDFSAILQMIGK